MARPLVCPVCPEFFCLCACVKLRAAGEYEERKMIRAAIRQIRDEQQQGDACFHSFDNNMEAVVLFVITYLRCLVDVFQHLTLISLERILSKCQNLKDQILHSG